MSYSTFPSIFRVTILSKYRRQNRTVYPPPLVSKLENSCNSPFIAGYKKREAGGRERGRGEGKEERGRRGALSSHRLQDPDFLCQLLFTASKMVEIAAGKKHPLVLLQPSRCFTL
jgi:hypothetical protein